MAVIDTIRKTSGAAGMASRAAAIARKAGCNDRVTRRAEQASLDAESAAETLDASRSPANERVAKRKAEEACMAAAAAYKTAGDSFYEKYQQAYANWREAKARAGAV